MNVAATRGTARHTELPPPGSTTGPSAAQGRGPTPSETSESRESTPIGRQEQTFAERGERRATGIGAEASNTERAERRAFGGAIGAVAPSTAEASVSEANGRIVLDAGGGDDRIDVTKRADGGVRVSVNGTNHDFSAEEANRLTIRAGGGDDRVQVDLRVQARLRIEGGSGNDDLRGGGGAETIVGGDGRDTIRGGGGDDRLEGGAGNDDLRGNDGDDTINGGDGRDLMTGPALRGAAEPVDMKPTST